jgi:hypothetical protein
MVVEPWNKKMRGLRTPSAGCALNTLLLALISSGRASDSRKHGKLRGLGSALINVSVSSMVCGALETPAGARQPGVGLGAFDAFDEGALQAIALSKTGQAQNEK